MEIGRKIKSEGEREGEGEVKSGGREEGERRDGRVKIR